MTPFIKALTRRGCITASPDTPISNVVMLMAENNVGAIVITNKDAIVVGIVSERDIVRKISINDNLGVLTAEGLMTKEVFSVSTQASSSELMHIMTNKKIRHLPIISNGKLLGIVSIGDVVKRILEKYENEAEQMRAFINS